MIVSVTITDSREAEIADALRSVVQHVDRMVLVDTGITDRTATRATEVAGDKLVVVKHAWVDFSSARNAGLGIAKELGAEWTIILDSDERFDFGGTDLRSALASAKSDVIRIESADGHYPKEKIMRSSAHLFFHGPTHEALIGGSRETMIGPTFWELPKTKTQLEKKFTRDIALLSKFTAQNPNDPRWWYYLGSSYEGMFDHVRAAMAFGECVERRKFGDEAAWAAYRQASMLFILGRFEETIAAAARGLGANATFAECAWIAAVAASRLGRSDQAIAWARISESVGRYKGCGKERSFFRDLPALYELPYDVLRFALPEGADQKQADAYFHAAKLVRLGVTEDLSLEDLSLKRNSTNRDEARRLLSPSSISLLCPGAEHTRIRFDPPNGWRQMNPSVCWHNGDLWCVVRTVNYSMKGREYTVHDADGIVRTENYLGKLSRSGELTDARLMRDLDTSPREASRIVGYEDVRLVSIDGADGPELTGSATVCDRDASRRMIARLHLTRDGDVERADVQPSNQLHEKNWMPLSVDGELTWIYSLDPTAVLPGPLRESPFALEHLRGGAAIVFEDGYLCVTHEVIEANEGRIYLHRFVQLDEGFNVIGVSAAWVFSKPGIEFCCGLAQDEDSLILSYGIDDCEAWIARISLDEVEAMKWMNP